MFNKCIIFEVVNLINFLNSYKLKSIQGINNKLVNNDINVTFYKFINIETLF